MSATSLIQSLSQARKDFHDLFTTPPSDSQLLSRAYQLTITDPPVVRARAAAARVSGQREKVSSYRLDVLANSDLAFMFSLFRQTSYQR